ncbi:aldo/keto reductase [Agromyces atrinae]|uniref:Aldo/keto reductase n=1 Tax=Agromyces atrinae TaxID=592376 RepID=A0A4Q2M7L4_9MICO|nr:aldo/keto reductase [Agromyces atrinae]NYD67541.1 aryl-alcohol dehydrogenase-like predicted oxidoreductase [Agromyces atrinae]RXZ88244.1 aldo/keto reductase [Agromyces atrinae]
MKYTRLGRSGLNVSRICLGTMNFGPVIDEHASIGILDAAVAAGVNFIDTADVYGGPPWGPYNGQTEEIVGRWIESGGSARRESIVLATKVHGTMGDGPNERGLSALHIRQGVEASLRRLKTDYIDLYQMHHIDRAVPVDEVLEAFSLLKQQGKIVYLGSSNFAGWNIAQYQELSRIAGSTGLVSEQSLYNLAQRTLELEVIPAAEHYGLGILPWSPLGGGILGGVLAKADRSRSAGAVEKLGDRLPQVERYEAFAARLGHGAGDLALAWLLHQPAVAAPIVGPRTLDQLEGGLRALEIDLTDADLAELDEIWPGPGGAAPEAYAW